MSARAKALKVVSPLPVPAPRRLLTAADVAEELDLKPATVRRMAAKGLIGYHRLNEKELRFTREDVENLLRRTRVEVNPQ